MTNTPWGHMHVLAHYGALQGDAVKVKLLTLNPGQRTSLQYHLNRSEILIPLTGNLMVERSLGCLNTVERYGVARVGPRDIHTIWNDSSTEDLVVLEIQHGTETSEEDIVRLEDPHKFNR